MTYHIYDVYQGSDRTDVKEQTQVNYTVQREKPPAETHILFGYIQEKQKEWVLKSKKYNIRFEEIITPPMAGPDYLVIYEDSNNIFGIYKIEGGPEFATSSELIEIGYPKPGHPEYFIFDLHGFKTDNFSNINFEKILTKYRQANRHGAPFTLSLLDMLNYKNNSDF